MYETRPGIVQTSIELKTGQMAHLLELATRFGYLQTRGPGAGELPSLSRFIQAIADGDIHVEKVKTE